MVKTDELSKLLELNPPQFQPPTPLQSDPEVTLTAIPVDNLPTNYTDEQHQSRNKMLKALPTREEFEQGLIRSFNLRLMAEEFGPAYTKEELAQISPKRTFLVRFNQKLHYNRHSLCTELTGIEQFLSRNHQKLHRFYHLSTGLWVKKPVKTLLLTLGSVISSLFFLSLSLN